MGFMDGIRDVLGGFNAVKRIDDTGFDWREKDAAEQAARNQLSQRYQQENADYLTKAGAEAAVGGMPENELEKMPELASLDPIRRKAAIARMVGQSAQAKSSLKDQDLYRQEALLRLRGDQRQDEIKLTGEEARALARVRAAEAAGMQPSPRDRYLAGEAMKRVETQQTNANWRDQNGPAGGSGAGGRWAWNTETNASEWVTPEKLFSAPPGMYTDPVSGRQGAGQQTNADAMGRITGNLDSALTNYERTQEGMGRVVPSWVSPDKAVAWDRYQSALQSAGQAFGRKVLNDTRVSNEDRIAYAKTIGQTSELMTMLDPTEARRRMQLLMDNEADYEAKYGGAQPPRSPRAPRGGGGGSGMPEPQSKAERDALPRGTRYKAPDGRILTKR